MVQTTLDALYTRCEALLIPSSHLELDEIAIKFHGRKRGSYLMRHKPAKDGINKCETTTQQYEAYKRARREPVLRVPAGLRSRRLSRL